MLNKLDKEPEEITDEERQAALDEAKAICAVERDHVIAAGGLCVVGTERHESRRIDNQLRGRSGRQGDPGETQFYLSLEDDLMRLFGGDRMDKIGAMMVKYDMPDDEPLQAKMVTKAVESAQRKVEEINFGMRKNVLDYDDVMNQQRQVIYAERNKVLDGKDLLGHIYEVMDETVENGVKSFVLPGAKGGEADIEGLEKWLEDLTGVECEFDVEDGVTYESILKQAQDFVHGLYEQRAERLGPEIMQDLAAQIMLRVIDTRWMSYLQEMDYLKTGIGLRGFGQRDPLVEYKHDAYEAFQALVAALYEDFLRTILRIDIAGAPQPAPQRSMLANATFSGPAEVDGDRGAKPAQHVVDRAQGSLKPAPTAGAGADKPRTYVKAESGDPYANVGRNDPCPCGSGKKFKNCHGKRA
jgi:preprotein translocase subunit SecA